jgi:hypothetical protein
MSQYKEILENELEMCRFFATVTNSTIGGLCGRIFAVEFQPGAASLTPWDHWLSPINGGLLLGHVFGRTQD